MQEFKYETPELTETQASFLNALKENQVDNIPEGVSFSSNPEDYADGEPATLDDAEFKKLLNSAIGEAVQEISALVELKNASKTGARRNYYERKIAKLQKQVGPLLASGANWIESNGSGATNG